MKTLNLAILSMLLLATGCASIAHADPTTKPADGGKTLKLSDAVDLNSLVKEGEANLSHQLNLSRGGRIYFGTIDTYDNDDKQIASLPIIAKKNGDSWKALPIRDDRLKDAAWSYVGGGPMRGELWGCSMRAWMKIKRICCWRTRLTAERLSRSPRCANPTPPPISTASASGRTRKVG